jgi:hypothetical protein
MEPLLILIPGLFGGLILALLIRGIRRGSPSTFVPIHLAAPSPTLINMANIRVEGVGGLGLVGAVVIVALNDSRIGLATILALVFGAALAVVLIVMRRRTGSLPSAGGGPDDRSVLHLEDEGRSRQSGKRAAGSAADLSTRMPASICVPLIQL